MIIWLGNWAACIVHWLMGGKWKTPKQWDEEARERRLEQKKLALERESLERWIANARRRNAEDRERLASVPPVAYHGETTAKEPVMTMPQQDAFPPKTIPSMDGLPSPTSPIFLFIVLTTENDDFQVVRVSSDTPHVPCVGNGEDVMDVDDFGTYSTADRALVVARKLNDEERARRFA